MRHGYAFRSHTRPEVGLSGGRRLRATGVLAVLVAVLVPFFLAAGVPVAAAAPRHGLGLVMSPGPAPSRETPRSAVALPASVDLTAYAAPVGDQGQVNSCSAWATDYTALGYWERRQGISGGVLAPMYTFSQITGGQNDGTTITSHLDIARQQGVDSQADYWQGTGDYWDLPTAAETANAAHWRLTTYSELAVQTSSSSTVTQTSIETALAAGQPVVIGIPVYSNFESLTGANNGFYSGPSGSYLGGHAITALGYDANGLRIENSWGTYWGDSGFATLSWAFVNAYVDEAVAVGQLANAPAPAVSAPVNTGRPAIAGIPQPGVTLTASSGTWSPAGSSYAYGWQRSTDGGSTWTPVGDGAAYVVQPSDLGGYLRVLVTATNAAGQGSATSMAVGPVAAPVLRNLVLPVIAGQARQGRRLFGTTGTWAPAPRAYAYQWQRSTNAGATWADIAGATGSAYTLGRADTGSLVRLKITARIASGTASAVSRAVGPVAGRLAVRRLSIHGRRVAFAVSTVDGEARPQVVASHGGRSVRLAGHGRGHQFTFSATLPRGRWVVKVSVPPAPAAGATAGIAAAESSACAFAVRVG